MLQFQMNRPEMLHSSMKPREDNPENKDIIQSAMVTPEVRRVTHENNILHTGLPRAVGKESPELISHSSKANMKANGPIPKTAMPIGHMRFAGAKKA